MGGTWRFDYPALALETSRLPAAQELPPTSGPRLLTASPKPRLVLRGLRHTWATLPLQEGIDIQIVSEPPNHSSTHGTREIYTHVTPPMQSDAAKRVARSIFGIPQI